jgi:hypothetical protein
MAMLLGSKLLLLGVVLQIINAAMLAGVFYIFFKGGWW